MIAQRGLCGATLTCLVALTAAAGQALEEPSPAPGRAYSHTGPLPYVYDPSSVLDHPERLQVLLSELVPPAEKKPIPYRDWSEMICLQAETMVWTDPTYFPDPLESAVLAQRDHSADYVTCDALSLLLSPVIFNGNIVLLPFWATLQPTFVKQYPQYR